MPLHFFLCPSTLRSGLYTDGVETIVSLHVSAADNSTSFYMNGLGHSNGCTCPHAHFVNAECCDGQENYKIGTTNRHPWCFSPYGLSYLLILTGIAPDGMVTKRVTLVQQVTELILAQTSTLSNTLDRCYSRPLL